MFYALHRRVPDYFSTLKREPTEADLVGSAKGAYHISLPVLPDPDLSALLAARLRAFPTSSQVHEALNASADSFYSSQVHMSPHHPAQLPTRPWFQVLLI